METRRLGLSKGVVLIPKKNNRLELIEIISDTFNRVKVKFLRTDSVVTLDSSVATVKPNDEWISNEITQKNNEILELEKYISKLKKL
jgi:hypothetical protein